MKILCITSRESLAGGIGIYVQHLARLFGDEFVLVTGKGAEINIEGQIVEIDNFDKYPNITMLKQIVGLVREGQNHEKITVIINSSGGHFLTPFLRIFTKTKLVPIFHGLISNYHGLHLLAVEILSYRFSHSPVFLNKIDMKRLGRKGQVISSFVDESIKVKPIQTGSVVVVARSSKQKNISLVLKSAHLLPATDFSIYGGGPLLQQDMDQAKKLSLKNTLFIKFESDRNVVYKNKSIFILPTFSEGFPLAIVEAATIGMPLILSDIPVLRELFDGHAIFVKNDDPANLAQTISQLQKDQKFYKKWSQKSQELEAKYTYDKWAKNWSILIKALG